MPPDHKRSATVGNKKNTDTKKYKDKSRFLTITGGIHECNEHKFVAFPMELEYSWIE